MTRIYTKTGDQGKTGLGGGQRVEKDSLRIEAYGTVDELNSFMGMARVECKNSKILQALELLQNALFDLGGDICMLKEDKIRFQIADLPGNWASWMEKLMDEMNLELLPLKEFILPGGCRGSAALHVCRTICRRAERRCVTLAAEEKINEQIIIFLNRLSDLFFVMARFENYSHQVGDVCWKKSQIPEA